VPAGVAAQDVAALRALLAAAGLRLPVPVVALVGGADGMAAEDRAACHAFVAGVLVPFAEAHGVCVVDGGTDTGVMAIAGRARTAPGAGTSHVGVAAAGTVSLPAEAEPHHTHLVVVPGDAWGDESPWLAAVATALAGPLPSVTVLANGGEVTHRDLRESLRAGRPVLVLAGTGRATDEIAGRSAAGRPALVEVVPDAAGLGTALARHLTGR
jgi:SLOG in TRPM, prokaryote